MLQRSLREDQEAQSTAHALVGGAAGEAVCADLPGAVVGRARAPEALRGRADGGVVLGAADEAAGALARGDVPGARGALPGLAGCGHLDLDVGGVDDDGGRWCAAGL